MAGGGGVEGSLQGGRLLLCPEGEGQAAGSQAETEPGGVGQGSAGGQGPASAMPQAPEGVA